MQEGIPCISTCENQIEVGQITGVGGDKARKGEGEREREEVGGEEKRTQREGGRY